MVKDTITDPKRIAQLLASELTGLETPPLDRVSVTDADESATPSPDGSAAYTIAVDGSDAGRVLLYADIAVVELDSIEASDSDGGAHVGIDTAADGTRLSLYSGISVKRVVDVLRDGLSE